ncbi:polyprenyl synthetase family protein [Microbacterium nymphoidis]|uniref:polyprenyl synthetase family protein n=1 Tax=Microbacterium nymphoidis TaxID=2898586 RepID=UPI001E553B2F|nr:polyprenyl synthetase family protein [Microbacterium nymphoidis]MCD2499127.1 polyprenyl synthetase family protein [Microbacterium nymphoidis]
MTLLSVDEDLRARIESRLSEQFAARTAAAQRYGAEFSALWRTAARHVLGGKLLRPRLLLALHEALTDDTAEVADATTVLDLAAAVETLHYSFLLHDDVIDADVQRRSRPNLIASLRDGHPRPQLSPREALHWGQSGAILLGDLLLSGVHQSFARAELPHRQRLRALSLLDHTVTETVAGELTDVALSDQVVPADLTTILAMSADKTATYTFELPLRLAAILAGRPPATETHLALIARHLGLAFQLQDDLLSVFGDAARHGKDPYSDLREGKRTALIAYARMTSAWRGIEPRLGRPDLGEKDAVQIRALLEDCGARTFVVNLINEHAFAARSLISGVDSAGLLPPAAQQVLLAVLDLLEGRES